MGLLEKLHQQIVQSDWTKKFEEEGKMNIEKIKEFIALRQDLYSAGVIGLKMHEDEVQVTESALVGEEGLCVKRRHCETYPYEVAMTKDGIKIMSIMTKKVLQETFPELWGYMEEDIDLTGSEDIA